MILFTNILLLQKIVSASFSSSFLLSPFSLLLTWFQVFRSWKLKVAKLLTLSIVSGSTKIFYYWRRGSTEDSFFIKVSTKMVLERDLKFLKWPRECFPSSKRLWWEWKHKALKIYVKYRLGDEVCILGEEQWRILHSYLSSRHGWKSFYKILEIFLMKHDYLNWYRNNSQEKLSEASSLEFHTAPLQVT